MRKVQHVFAAVGLAALASLVAFAQAPAGQAPAGQAPPASVRGSTERGGAPIRAERRWLLAAISASNSGTVLSMLSSCAVARATSRSLASPARNLPDTRRSVSR